MTNRPPLHDFGASRAVLMGTWDYRHLPHLPAARNSLQRMKRLLTGELCGWPGSRVTVLRNQDGTGHLADRLITQFENVTDVALFYFVGHGQMAEADHGSELCLGLVGSRLEAHRRVSTGLPFRAVREALRHSPAAKKIVILDCCYAGLATLPGNTLGPRIDVSDTVTVAGACTLAASAADSVAWFETDASWPQTYFTKYLADTIETGIPGQSEVLRLRSVFTGVCDRLVKDGHPQLPIGRNVNSAHDLGFAYNAAPSAGAAPTNQTGPQPPARQRRRRIAVLAAALALIAGGVLAATLPGVGSTGRDPSGFAWAINYDMRQNGGLIGIWSTGNDCSPGDALCRPTASVVVGTAFSGLTAYDPATGRQQWHWQPPGKNELCAMSPSDDGGDGDIAAFEYGPDLTCRYLQTISVSTGKLNWAKAISLVGPGATGAPVNRTGLSISGDTVIAPYDGSADPSPSPDTPDNDLLGASVRNGTVNWSTNLGTKPMRVNWSTPTMAGGCQLSGAAAADAIIGMCGGQDWVLSMTIGPIPLAPLPGCAPITSEFVTGFMTAGPDGLVIGCNLGNADFKLYVLHTLRDGSHTAVPMDLTGVDASIIDQGGVDGQQPSNMLMAGNTMYLVGGLNRVNGGPNDSVVAVDMDTGKQLWTATLPGNSSVRLLASTDEITVTLVAHGSAAPAMYTVRAPGSVHRDYVLNPDVAASFLDADKQSNSTYALAEGVNIAVGFYGFFGFNPTFRSQVIFGVLPR